METNYQRRLRETRENDYYANMRLKEQREAQGLPTGVLDIVLEEQRSKMIRDSIRKSKEDMDDRRLMDYPI